MAAQEEVGKDHKDHGQAGPLVEFLYLKNNDEVSFKVSWNDTLAAVWTQAYVELKEERLAKDELECQKSGDSLKNYLSLSLSELRDRHICADRKFQIKSETGGA